MAVSEVVIIANVTVVIIYGLGFLTQTLLVVKLRLVSDFHDFPLFPLFFRDFGHKLSFWQKMLIEIGLFEGYNGYFLLKKDGKSWKNDDHNDDFCDFLLNDDDARTLGNIHNRIANCNLWLLIMPSLAKNVVEQSVSTSLLL